MTGFSALVSTTIGGRRGALFCLILLLMPLAVFWQVRNHGFITYDDYQYVTENSDIQRGLSRESIAWAFTTVHGSNWHPLTWVSHMLDVQLFGLHPGGHHLGNVILHLASTLLIFVVFSRMTGEVVKVFVIAALFAVHPLHVESVAWVSERKDVLSAFFLFLTIGAYLGYVGRRSSSRYLLVVLCFTLGLLAKPTIVTLPFVLLLLDFWPLGRLPSLDPASRGLVRHALAVLPLIREKAPLFVLSLVTSTLTLYAPWLRGTLAAPEIKPFATRLGNAVVSYVAYVGKTVLPLDLSFLYLYPEAIPPWKYAGATLLLAGTGLLAARFGGRRPHHLVGWLWYVGTLLPMIGLVQVGVQSMADRYTYIPHVGLFVIATWGLPELTTSWRYGKGILAIGAAAVLAIFSVLSWRQAGYWKDSATLYTHALEVSAGNFVAHFGLGVDMIEKGRPEEALRHYQRAVQAYPGHAQARYELVRVHNLVGVARGRSGRLEEAVEHFSAALRIDPASEESHVNLGIALARQGRVREALEQYRSYLGINPASRAAHFRLATLLSEQGAAEEANRHLMLALGIDPDAPDAAGRLEQALAEQSPAPQGERP